MNELQQIRSIDQGLYSKRRRLAIYTIFVVLLVIPLFFLNIILTTSNSTDGLFLKIFFTDSGLLLAIYPFSLIIILIPVFYTVIKVKHNPNWIIIPLILLFIVEAINFDWIMIIPTAFAFALWNGITRDFFDHKRTQVLIN